MVVAASLHLGASAYASTDYGPAIYRPMSGCSKWYTTGSRKFVVIHDMEGYYASTISYLNRCDISTSVHYMVNGLKDASSDYPAGEVDQQVREAYWAWHARCWNQYALGTEHEGFVSNPAWFTEAMYQASALLQRHLCDDYAIAKDRNHIVGHDGWKSAAWRTYAEAHFGTGFDASCNTHSDPGANWDWSHFMDLINGQNPPYLFDSNTEGFTTANGTGPLMWNGSSWPGVLYCDQTANDAYIRSPAAIVAGTANTVVNVSFYPQNLNVNPTLSHDMAVFWKTSADNTWTSSKSTPTVSYSANNQWVVMNLDVNNAAWTGKTINQFRLDFDQTNVDYRWIVNHMLLQTVPRYYYGANAEGWTTSTGMGGILWTGNAPWLGVIYADQTGNDGQFISPAISFRGAWNDVIHVRVYPQNGTSANHDMQVFYKTTASATFTAAKSSAIVYYTAQNSWADVYLPVGGNTNWSGYTGQTITQLRVDVDNVSSATRFIIDSVTIEHSTNVVYDVPDQIVDNTAATVVSTWSTGTASTDKYGADYRFSGNGTGSAYLQFTPNNPVAGNYQVYEWHPQGSNRTTAAPHVVTHSAGSTQVNVNQTVNGGQWNLLGTFNFSAGTGGNVKITDAFPDTTQVVVADAIKFVYVP
jgi:hypothetical protein